MSENYKIVSKFIKDISGETPNIETYLYVKDILIYNPLRINMSQRQVFHQRYLL